MEEYEISYIDLQLTEKDFATELGYKVNSYDPYIKQQITNLTTKLITRVKPKFAFQIFQGKSLPEHGLVCINGIELKVGNVIATILNGSTSFAVFVATAGWDFDAILKEIVKENDLLNEFLLNALGTCIVEKSGDYLESVLQERIGGLKHSKRFSPGYCGWPLLEQKKIFQFLDGNPCNIILSDYCLMSPIKSISGIIGIGKNIKSNLYGCAICNMNSCYKRKNKKI